MAREVRDEHRDICRCPAGRRHQHLRTSCGRELTVGRLALGDDRYPAQRIFVDLGACPGCEMTAWAGLTVTQARQLARALVSEAAAAEQDSSAGR
jgi:hypothetical protein